MCSRSCHCARGGGSSARSGTSANTSSVNSSPGSSSGAHQPLDYQGPSGRLASSQPRDSSGAAAMYVGSYSEAHHGKPCWRHGDRQCRSCANDANRARRSAARDDSTATPGMAASSSSHAQVSRTQQRQRRRGERRTDTAYTGSTRNGVKGSEPIVIPARLSGELERLEIEQRLEARKVHQKQKEVRMPRPEPPVTLSSSSSDTDFER